MNIFKFNNRKRKLIRLSKSVLSSEEKKAVNQVINEGYLGMGKYVQIFEKELSTIFTFSKPFYLRFFE